MGVVLSTTAELSPLSLASIVIGIISFVFTLGTFLRVVWVNLMTLSEAPHQVHGYLTHLRQELLEERASLRALKKHTKHRRKDEREGSSVYGIELDEQALKTMSDALKTLIKRFEAVEAPFLDEGEEGIQQSGKRRSRRRSASRAPYYTHSAYASPHTEKRADSDHEDDDDRYWPQRVRYRQYGLGRRFMWLNRRSEAENLFEVLSRLQTRRTARQVGALTVMMYENMSKMTESHESLRRVDDRLQRVIGVRRVE
ncbi:hypothetical protein B0A48_12362 [Cryoendolithus antarcticus]|uniref:Uncharacterized protein n=1 Tax=Cryoendolithus antarcticus TaxID=1507870 RepID=A0A1V8SS46_9PEZI|nr:hypothetical protein B0A48_12362 [Cryoendolithus antarcticus]